MHAPGTFNPVMIKRYRSPFTDDVLERHRLAAVAASCNHDAEHTLVDEIGAGGSETRSKQAIPC